MLVLAFAWSRGAAAAIPILVVAVLFISPTPFRVIGLGAAAYLAILLAAAVGGLLYSLIGRRVLRVRWVGGFIAGSLVGFPYALVLTWIIAGFNKSAWSPSEFRAAGGWVVSGFLAVVIGGIFARVRYTERSFDPERDDELASEIGDAGKALGGTRGSD